MEPLLHSHSVLQILVLDDHLDDFQTLQRVFRRKGCTHALLHFRRGEDAAAYLCSAGHSSNQSERAFLILMNLREASRNQLESLRELKSQGNCRAVPVIVLADSRDDSLVRECYQEGASSFLYRSADPLLLADQIDALLNYWCRTALLPVRDSQSNVGLQTVV